MSARGDIMNTNENQNQSVSGAGHTMQMAQQNKWIAEDMTGQDNSMLGHLLKSIRYILLTLMLAWMGNSWAIVTSATTLTASPSQSVVGQAVILIATVTGSSPTGTVTFMEGATTIGTGTLESGVAAISYTFDTARSRILTAIYAGDENNATSTSADVRQNVNKATTVTTLSASPNPSTVGTVVTLTATIKGHSPHGSVTFSDGMTTLGTSTLESGIATLNYTFNAAGVHTLTAATYAGDENNATSASSAITQTVNPAISTTTLTANPDPSTAGQAVMLTASVTGFLPSGTVTFYDGVTMLGTATLTAGTANLSSTFTTTGAHSLTASYAGNANNTDSTSAAVNITVNSGVADAYYIHTDHLDTPRQITDSNGTVVWQWDNLFPFGENIANANPNGAGQFSFNLRFPGQYFDGETLTHYNINRDYDPSIGRYIQSDPIGLGGGLNTYTYVGGNPLIRTDSTGEGWEVWVFGGVIIVTGVEWYYWNVIHPEPLPPPPPPPNGDYGNACHADNSPPPLQAPPDPRGWPNPRLTRPGGPAR